MKTSITDKIKANYTSTLSQCSNCPKLLAALSNKGVIKNRHDARFWGLPQKKILCGNCLGQNKQAMPARKCYLWTEYQKRGYWEHESKL